MSRLSAVSCQMIVISNFIFIAEFTIYLHIANILLLPIENFPVFQELFVMVYSFWKTILLLFRKLNSGRTLKI